MAQLNSQHGSQKMRMAEKHALNSSMTGGGFPYSSRSSRVVPAEVLPRKSSFLRKVNYTVHLPELSRRRDSIF